MPFKKLIQGFRNFQAEHFAEESELFERLAQGQSPETMVIACSDSRIDPAILTKSAPGEIFSVRNVAAMVPHVNSDTAPSTASAVEYAVKVLKVKHIVVMGHALCGGVRALAEAAEVTEDEESFIGQWISIGAAARAKVMKTLSHEDFEEQVRVLEQATILVSLSNILSYPGVQEAIDSGHLHLHGWYFDIPNGRLLSYNPVSRAFEDVLHGKMGAAVSAEMVGCGETTLSIKEFVAQFQDDKIRDENNASIMNAVADRMRQLCVGAAVAGCACGMHDVAYNTVGTVI